MGFDITYVSGDRQTIYAGQIISYRIRIFPGMTTFWMTEIKNVREPYYFSDEQRFGPYSFWNHQHHFRELPEGIEMTDELAYAIPYGWLGRLAHKIFVGPKIKEVFQYREKILNRIYPNTMVINRSA